jgi:hypothetical protein
VSYLDLLLLPAAVLLVLVLQYALIVGWALAVVLGRMARSVLPGSSLRKRTPDDKSFWTTLSS